MVPGLGVAILLRSTPDILWYLHVILVPLSVGGTGEGCQIQCRALWHSVFLFAKSGNLIQEEVQALYAY